MNPRIIAALCLFLAVGFAVSSADEYDESPESYQEDQYEDAPSVPAPKNGKPDPVVQKPKPVIGDPKTGTTGLAKPGHSDLDAAKHKGFCHWGVAVWYKPGFQIKCSCMRCTCQNGGNWDCAYHFAYCPYYYCGNQIYNPLTHLCCCGKVHEKKADYRCCGYFYYHTKTSKCCNYYSVKSVKSHCPRDKI